MSEELKRAKIFPLNQTAKSDVLVRGNPVTTRADDGVENTFPGLEFDHRNLEKQFFPGLMFELHSSTGGWLRSFDQTMGFPFSQDDFEAGLLLWRVIGRFPDPSDPSGSSVSEVPFFGSPSRRNATWQTIREIEPGEVGIVMGPNIRDNLQIPPAIEQEIQNAIATRQDLFLPIQDLPPIVVLFGQRADYLKNGVIDPDTYEPGDLTRSLCSPWQYDFTDCGCWYWASNKPDMVAVTDDGPQIYNFQRVRTGDTAQEPPTHPPVVSYPDWRSGRTTDESGAPLPASEVVPAEMNHAELIRGWEILPIVINDRETDRFVEAIPETIPDDELFPDLATIIARLEYLAGVEHALMIEYLYGYYSINAPRERPDPAQIEETRLFEAAHSILGVAIDEMRHFRWVNEILVMFGQAPVVQRALQTLDTDNNGRFLAHTFELVPATQTRVDWFITVEQSSQDVDPDLGSDTIDGMYTRLLLSVERSAEINDDLKKRAIHLIKLIIDEGYDHFHRFQRVRQLLPSPPDESYLRLPDRPNRLEALHPAKGYEIRVDRSYEVILNLLLIMFGRGDQEHGQMLEATRIIMVDSLDVEIRNLIAGGGAPLFSLPQTAATTNLGRFSLNVASGTDFAMSVEAQNDVTLDVTSILLNATGPLDELNERALTVDNQVLQAEAQRSAAVLERVRQVFVKIMSVDE